MIKLILNSSPVLYLAEDITNC